MTEQLKHWDKRIKELMEQVGYPNSMSLYQAFKQFQNELTTSKPAQAGEVPQKAIDWHAVTLSLDEAHDESLDGRHGVARKMLRKVCAEIRASLPQPAQAGEVVDDGDITGQAGPLPEHGWDEVSAGAFRKPSPTVGMNLWQRIKHVGGRENAAGYIEFGSVMAVRALVRQYVRDLPTQPAAQATPAQDGTRSPFDGEPMSARKAAYFMRRFKREEKLLGPNEQLAIDYVLALLDTQQATPEPERCVHPSWSVDEAGKCTACGLPDATQQAAGEPVYQIKGEAFECPHAWRDATEEAFYTTPAADRRIVYTHPAPVETEPQQAAGEPVGEPWGWAILDKHGIAQAIRPRRKEFFGCVQKTTPFTAEDVERMDREWAGLAPHCVVTLHTHPAPGVPELPGADRQEWEKVVSIAAQVASASMVPVKAHALRAVAAALAAAQAKGGE